MASRTLTAPAGATARIRPSGNFTSTATTVEPLADEPPAEGAGFPQPVNRLTVATAAIAVKRCALDVVIFISSALQTPELFRLLTMLVMQ
jgi:hypothetical protein